MKNNPEVLILIETSRACGRGILFGVAKYSRLHGPWTLYKSPPYYRLKDRKSSWLNYIKKMDVQAVIFCGEGQNADEIKQIEIPAVTVDVMETVEGPINIIGDCDSIGQMAAEHFIERGFSNFGYCGYDDIHWSRERRDVFCQLLKNKGYSVNVYKGSRRNKWTKEQEDIADWLKNLDIPLAIMACNDDRAQMVIEACKISGLKVPDDVAVIGVDNDEAICLISDPPISSINLNFQRAGYEAAATLDAMVRKKKLSEGQKKIVIPTTGIMTRQSTDIFAIDNEQVRKALSFIRNNYNVPIQVRDVVNVTAQSRRALEKNFRKLLGKSIFEQIRKTKIQKICSLLLETNMTINEIADCLNFKDFAHISRYFQSEMKVTPLEYRKKYGSK